MGSAGVRHIEVTFVGPPNGVVRCPSRPESSSLPCSIRLHEILVTSEKVTVISDEESEITFNLIYYQARAQAMALAKFTDGIIV